MFNYIIWCDPINSLTPGRLKYSLWYVIFKIILVIDGWCTSCKIALRWMPLDLTGETSTLVQVMAWCRQAASHYLSHCWPRSMSPYGVTRPQWVKHGQFCPKYSKSIPHSLPTSVRFQVSIVAIKSMAWCKTAVSPACWQWRYCSLPLSHWIMICVFFYLWSYQAICNIMLKRTAF